MSTGARHSATQNSVVGWEGREGKDGLPIGLDTLIIVVSILGPQMENESRCGRRWTWRSMEP